MSSESIALQNIKQFLKNDDDLDKIESLKEQLIKEKSLLDVQLKSQSQSKLESTFKSLDVLNQCQDKTKQLRENVTKINKLANESFGSIKRYELINKITKIHEIFDESTSIADKISEFNNDLDEVEALIEQEDYKNIDIDSSVDNLLLIHYKLNKLRDFQEKLIELSEHSNADSRFTIKKVVSRIYEVINKFNILLENIIIGIVESVKIGNYSLVVRLAKIIDFEEREDFKVRILQTILVRKAQDEQRKKNESTLSNFSNNGNSKPITKVGFYQQILNGTVKGRLQERKYKEFFIEKVKESVEEIFKNCYETYASKNQFEVLNNLDWVFQDLLAIKQDLVKLVPEKWDIFKVYFEFYYNELNKLINKLIEAEPETLIILEILDFDNKYNDIMKEEFGFTKEENKSIIGEEEKDQLLTDYLNLILLKMKEWLSNLKKTEHDVFRARIQAPESDSENLLALEGSKIVFQMFTQQCDVASGSGQGKILAGVITHFSKLLIERQNDWSNLIKSEVQKLLISNNESNNGEAGANNTVPPGLIEYLTALANDQMRGADYTEAISNKYGSMVSKKYSSMIHSDLEKSIDGFANLAKQCCDALIVIIFDDLKVVFEEIFNKDWYNSNFSQQISDTLYEYLGDLKITMNPYLFEILSEEIIEETIIRYLNNLKKEQKFKNTNDKFINSVKHDFEIFYKLFIQFVSKEIVESKFKIIEFFMDLCTETNQELILKIWLNAIVEFNDLNMEFLSLILKNRKDIDSSSVKLLVNKATVETTKYLQEHQYDLKPSFMNRL